MEEMMPAERQAKRNGPLPVASRNTDIESTIEQHIGQLQLEMERLRRSEADEREKKEQLRAKAQQEKLDKFIELQVQSEELRAKFWKRVLAVVTSLTVVGGGGGATCVLLKEPEVKPADIQSTVTNRMDHIEKVIEGEPDDSRDGLIGKVELNTKKVDRLGDLHMQQQELMLEVRAEIADKLDAISARARRVPARKKIEEARKDVEAYKKRKERQSAESALKKGDPFADL